MLEAYRRDQAAPGRLAAGMPAVLVRPAGTAQVLRAAARHGVPVVPRGAGSGLSGGANAVDGCLPLCLERMTRVVEVDAAALTATVQAGVLNAQLAQAARNLRGAGRRGRGDRADRARAAAVAARGASTSPPS